jgi:hypothetical protein
MGTTVADVLASRVRSAIQPGGRTNCRSSRRLLSIAEGQQVAGLRRRVPGVASPPCPYVSFTLKRRHRTSEDKKGESVAFLLLSISAQSERPAK